MFSTLPGYERLKRFAHLCMTGFGVQIVFNLHNPVKLKILTVNPYVYEQVLLFQYSVY